MMKQLALTFLLASMFFFGFAQEKQELVDKASLYSNQNLLAGLGVFLLVAFLLYRNNRQKQKANAVLQEQKKALDKANQSLKMARREAQIEAALERVRSRAIAMRRSDELAEAAELLYNEFLKLGVESFSCGYLINDDEKGEWKVWLTNPGEPFFKEFWTIPYDADHNLKARYESWKRGEEFHSAVLQGEANRAHHIVIAKYAPWKADLVDNLPPQLVFNSAHFSLGHLFVLSPEKLPVALEQAMVRFAKVFDLAYRRFLDLQKAEARTREERIEAGLDRVRAKIASMRSTEDLQRITPLVWRELTTLEVPFFRCGVFIMDEEKEQVHTYLSTPGGQSLSVLHLPFDAAETTRKTVAHWRKQEVYLDSWDQQQFTEWVQSLTEQGYLQEGRAYQGADQPPESPAHAITRIQSATPDLPQSKNTKNAEEENRHPGLHILIVDDEPINQQVLKNHLASQNFRISQALNGEEALRILENEETIDLVLLDVMMPRMSGYEVCEKIRQKKLPSELPVIMVTAKNRVQDLVQGLALGANDYIAKPFSREEFLARIHTQLDLHRIFEVTGRFVPNEFIHALGKERITEVSLGDQTEREVTVLFSDIRNYTALSETMTPEQNFRFINAFHGRMGPVIQQNRGFVNQYLGDGIMAIFPQSAEDALNAAIQIHRNLHQYNQTRRDKGRKVLRIGIGLHTGPLIMGIIGDERRMDAATIADTVNSASRIENLTKHYGAGILFSGATLDQLPDRAEFNFRYLGRAQVKGKAEPLPIYECFDGDEPAVREGKARTAEAFSEALQSYLSRSFDQATTLFRQILA